MLTDLREKSQSFFIYILFGILIIVFIFFFGPQAEGCQPGVQTRSLSGWAAKVNGESISVREVEISVRRQALYQQDSPDDPASIAKLRLDTLDQVIEQTVLEQRAAKMGLAIGEKELSRYIVSDENPDYPLFTNRDGQFTPKQYRDQLTQLLGATPEAYRRAKRREWVVSRYLGFLAQQVAISDEEVRGAFDRANRSWNLEYVKFNTADYSDQVQAPTDAEVETAVKEQAADIKADYEKNKDRYVRDAEYKISRVLIRKPKGDGAIALQAARDKAEGLLKKAKEDGADFAAIATESSEGYYKNSGGDMGWQGKKNTSAEDYAAYGKLKKGEVSDIQDSSIGFWFAKVTDIKPALNRPLETVQSDIARSLLISAQQSKAARKDADAALAQLKQTGDFDFLSQPQAAVDGDSAEAPADAAPSQPAQPTKQVQTTGPVRADRPVFDLFPGLGRSELLAQRLDSLTTKAPVLPEVMTIGDSLVVLRLKERVEPDDAKFNESKSTLEDRLKNARAGQLLGQWRAIVFGPTSQRAMYQKFANGAMLTGLVDRAEVKINESKFPQPSAVAAEQNRP